MELRKFCKSFGQHGTVPPPSSALDLLPSRGEHALSRYAPIAIAGTAFLVCTYGSYRVANRRRVVVRKVAAVRKPSKALSKARHRKVFRTRILCQLQLSPRLAVDPPGKNAGYKAGKD